YNASIKGKMTPTSLLLLTLCALSNGVTDFSQKLFVKTLPEDDPAVFNLYTYAFAALILGICFLLLRRKERNAPDLQAPRQILRPIIGYVAVMAVCLFLNSYFKTLAASHLTATQLYPLNQGGSVILSMLMSAILFRERINARCVAGVTISFVALLMINLL
ncbi:MAG: EamA family transporter, partial [Clostridia bacterium]|nr:EamA family transporter [Clostridia bacterium]